MSDKKTVSDAVRLDRLRELIDGKRCSRQEIASDPIMDCDVSLITKHYNGDRPITMEFLIKYCKYFNVSADYLLGQTGQPTLNPKMKEICEYTGMSETVIEYLHVCSDFGLPDIHFLNELIGESAVVQKAMMENGDNIESMDWPDLKNDTLLTTLVDYMEADFQQNSGERFYISANGNVVDPHSCDSQNTLTHWKDLISVTSISAGEIAEQILKSRITNAVVGFKQKYQPD